MLLAKRSASMRKKSLSAGAFGRPHSSIETNSSGIKVSYCTTCHGRLWQLALTLFDNLDHLREDEEIVLLDYGSPDGLGRFVESSKRCQEAISQGKLVYAFVEAEHYHCPKAKNLAHRLGRGDLLVNLDADNSNRGVRQQIDQCFAKHGEDTILQMHEHSGGFGLICFPKYWFYRLGGYDESFLPMGYQDIDLLWRAEAMGLCLASGRAGSPPPIRNTIDEKAIHTGYDDWWTMRNANRAMAERNWKEGRIVANPEGWGGAVVRVNFGIPQRLAPMPPYLISIVLAGSNRLARLNQLLERYNRIPVVGEILVVNTNANSPIETNEKPDSKVKVINVSDDLGIFSRFAVAAQTAFPAVLLTDDDVFLPEETLGTLHKGWSGNPSILHGVLNGHASQKRGVNGNAARPCKIVPLLGVLTTASDCFRSLCLAPRYNAELTGTQKKNGADILLSSVVAQASHRLNMAYRLPVEKLRAAKFIGTTRPKGFLESRSKATSWCRKNVLDPISPALRKSSSRTRLASVLLLNWKRPENVIKIIEHEKNFSSVGEILVFNNNPEVAFEYVHPKVKVINASCDFGLRTRWILAALATHDYLIFQDDDVLIQEDAIHEFIRQLSTDPERIYSMNGRNLDEEGLYDSTPAVGDVEIALTRAAAIHKSVVPLILSCESRFQKGGFKLPPANGEDIFLSFCLTAHFGKRHQVLDLPYVELNSPYALSAKLSHVAERIKITRSCQQFFETETTRQTSDPALRIVMIASGEEYQNAAALAASTYALHARSPAAVTVLLPAGEKITPLLADYSRKFGFGFECFPLRAEPHHHFIMQLKCQAFAWQTARLAREEIVLFADADTCCLKPIQLPASIKQEIYSGRVGLVADTGDCHFRNASHPCYLPPEERCPYVNSGIIFAAQRTLPFFDHVRDLSDDPRFWVGPFFDQKVINFALGKLFSKQLLLLDRPYNTLRTFDEHTIIAHHTGGAGRLGQQLRKQKHRDMCLELLGEAASDNLQAPIPQYSNA